MMHIMPALPVLIYDVFTNTRFQGNQLAVFPDARGVAPELMQTLAREMNFSESTFVLPADQPGTDVRMRIFTPGSELPVAGHPTIGTTFALAQLGVIVPPLPRFVFGRGVGPTPVELTWQDRALSFAWMDQRPPEYRTPASSDDQIIRATGVDKESHLSTGLPIEEISCGVPFMFVPVATRAAVDAAEPDIALLRRLTSGFGLNDIGVFVFSTEDCGDDVTAYSRMFAPGLGVPEDPATGIASGPLGCYLVKHRLVAADRTQKMVSLQGVAMGRPSRIHIAITGTGGDSITRVQVGGQAVSVGEGTITI
jgi:trans-2,3-dihydro-3-hydroxyanthranilate isomerase